MHLSSNNKRVLNVFSLVMINVIAIDSLRNLPTNAQTGYHALFYYLAATLLFLVPCILITAELATHYPKTGGVYVWVREAFGPRWAFVTIWLQWIYNVVWYPTILVFLATNIAYLIAPHLANNKTYLLSMVIGLFLLASVANNFGMKISGLLSALSAIVGTIIPMVFLIVLGTYWAYLHPSLLPTLSWPHFVPQHTHNLAFVVVVLFSMMGLEMSSVHAQEVKQPERNYPRALRYSSLLIIMTLILSTLAIVVIVPQHHLNLIAGLDQAFVIILKTLHLSPLLPLLILLIILGGFGGMSAWVIGPAKGLMVAAEDGCAPRFFGYKNSHQAPTLLLVLQFVLVGVLSYCFVYFKSIQTSYWLLSDLTAQLALLFYILFFAAAIKLRTRLPQKDNAFRIPGGRFVLWTVSLIGILTCFSAIIIGFIPPDTLALNNTTSFKILLGLGIIIGSLMPLALFRSSRITLADSSQR